jgi:enoyl-[acyl-carrier protein] reductase/trans-2-enoyl-CoA reductase (NAD+)
METRMIVQPKVRGFICTTAHPKGCRRNVEKQIQYIQSKGKLKNGPKNVLIIGASTGFGLASRITAAFGAGANTIGVSFEKPASDKRTASAGWYNTAAFEEFSAREGLKAISFNGDAFSHEMKAQVIKSIKNELNGKIDLVVYSIASPRRQHPETGTIHNSTLKPIGDKFVNKTVDVMKGEVISVTIDPATPEDIQETIKVMGGEDWGFWINQLLEADCLSRDCKTVAYTYIGPGLTHRIYREGTIGEAKAHLENTAVQLNTILHNKLHGQALISVNKALVTQASAAIPVVPLYISILFDIMKEKGTHEGCIEQMQRLLYEKMYADHRTIDICDRIRIDDWEMDPEVQAEVEKRWKLIETSNIDELSDLNGYLNDFYQLFGFHLKEVDYNEDVNINIPIPSIKDSITN